jgi:hypothetical protein
VGVSVFVDRQECCMRLSVAGALDSLESDRRVLADETWPELEPVPAVTILWQFSVLTVVSLRPEDAGTVWLREYNWPDPVHKLFDSLEELVEWSTGWYQPGGPSVVFEDYLELSNRGPDRSGYPMPAPVLFEVGRGAEAGPPFSIWMRDGHL